MCDAHLQRSAGGVLLSLQSWSSHLSRGHLDIASYLGLEGDQVTDRCGTRRLGGQVCLREVLIACLKSDLPLWTIGTSTWLRLLAIGLLG